MRTDKWLPEIERFASEAGHFTVKDLIELIRKAGVPVSRATIYRGINKMLKAAKIVQISNEKERLFEFVREEIHYHFRCIRGGKIIEFYFKDIEDAVKEGARKLNLLMTGQKLIVEGICFKCNREYYGGKKIDRGKTERS